MGDDELGSLIAETKAKMGELISKPKMSDKLLSKPPFRFLHDTVTAVINTTGFGEGLFQDSELDSAQITDKHAKIDFLEKIFLFVSICKGGMLEVRAAKVVAGLEPEFTNKFLIALAESASNPSIDNAEAVRLCLSGAQPGSQPPLKSGGRDFPAAESKQNDTPSADFSAGSKGQPSESTERKGDGGSKQVSEAKNSAAAMAEIEPAPSLERGKSRSGTRSGRPQSTADTGLSGIMGAPTSKNLDSEIEKCDGSEAMTQQLLGELIIRPRLTEKLLSKPPFRFLHDVVMEVSRATGFAADLYDADESDSTKVSDKTQKMNFLEKIIRVVGIQLNTMVEAKPAKIVAGLDPQNTNNFLQLLAVAAKHAPDSRGAVRTVLEQRGEVAPQAGSVPVERGPDKDDGGAKQQQQQMQMQAQQINSARSIPTADEKPSMQSDLASQSKDPGFNADDRFNNQDDGEGGDSKRSARPTTARRRPPKVKEGAQELQAKDVAPAAAKKATGIIIDGADDEEEEEEVIPTDIRLADAMGADAKQGPGAGGMDAQSKLVKDIISRQAEQEVASAKNEPVEENKNGNEQGAGGGIRLGRLRKTGLEKRSGSAGGVGYGENDLEKLRSAIQTLVQHTGPLGSCMDYIQEDITLMTSELHKWEEECRKYEVENEDMKRKTKESLHPLKVELADLEDQIFEQIARISSTKASIARNDEKIQQILKMSATA